MMISVQSITHLLILNGLELQADLFSCGSPKSVQKITARLLIVKKNIQIYMTLASC